MTLFSLTLCPRKARGLQQGFFAQRRPLPAVESSSMAGSPGTAGVPKQGVGVSIDRRTTKDGLPIRLFFFICPVRQPETCPPSGQDQLATASEAPSSPLRCSV